MCIHRFVILAACCCLLAISSAQADTAKTLQDVNAVADTVGQVVSSPAGQFLPEPVRTIVLVVTNIIIFGLGLFFKKQSGSRLQALSCVTRAVENSGAAGERVKENVAAQMGDPNGEQYKKLNAVVDKALNA
jgi:hypothetical protein